MRLSCNILFILILTTSYCSDDDASGNDNCSTEALKIPTVNITCSESGDATDCADASADDTQALGFWTDRDTSCNGFDVNEDAYTARTGSNDSVACDGTSCTASLSDWQDSGGAAMTTFSGGSIKICAFIDTNSNSELDSGEPVQFEEFFYDSCSSKSVSLTGFFDASGF